MKRTLLICLLACGAARGQDAGALYAVLAGGSVAWTPTQLGSKLAIWLDASDASTVLDAGGDPASDAEAVQTWQDKSGNARHATAPSETRRPSYRTGIQNGRSVLRTDGGDALSVGSALGIFRAKSAAYIFAVAKETAFTGGTTFKPIFLSYTTGAEKTLFNAVSASTAGARYSVSGRRTAADSLASVASSTTVSGHNMLLCFADWSSGYARVSLNLESYSSVAYSSGAGATEDGDSYAAPNLFAQVSYMANTMSANSEIAEIIVVNAAMTAAEITATESYLKAKWGTP